MMFGAGLIVFALSLWANGIAWGFVAGHDDVSKIIGHQKFAPFQIATILGMAAGGIAMGY